MEKILKKYPNYKIDENGNITNIITGKLLKGSIGENGYKYYRLIANNKKTMEYCHRLVATAFLDNPNNYPVVNHKDGNKLNNNVNNLEWTTYSVNAKEWHNSRKDCKVQKDYYLYDLPNELWKTFGSYEVSSYGRVKRKDKDTLLRPSMTCGYYKVRLSENGLVTDYLVHQLVYKVFFDNYDPTKIIDHKDGNKLNNNINNLRLLSNSENAYASLYETHTNSSAKQVEQYDLSGNLLNTFYSTRQAGQQLGLDASTISKVCRGQNKTHGGFIFKYSNK